MPVNPAVHYKAVYVFNYGGRRDLALRALEYLESTLMDGDGGFRDAAFTGRSSPYLYARGLAGLGGGRPGTL
ncbi:MAG: hypothetical protein FJ029_00115 [Actinobacteria bacterium]|nr:hypothetical protein [Actinomycetota bacterium]